MKNGFTQLSKIKKTLKGLPNQIKHPSINKELKVYQAQGCPECNQTGYRGRIGIFELILIDEEMEKLVATAPGHIQILEAARQQGMVGLYQDALLKVLEQMTTLEEVARVTGE